MPQRIGGADVGGTIAPSGVGPQGRARASSFAQELESVLGRSSLQFSKHAARRIERREISLSQETLSRLEQGTVRAAEKGSRASLVLVDDLAFIVNVATSTVVTAVDASHRQENVFTNIDSAVLA